MGLDASRLIAKATLGHRFTDAVIVVLGVGPIAQGRRT